MLRLQRDERLIALIRNGQERAFEALVDRYQVRLQAFCRGMLASAEDAEDVLQEVFVAAHKAILADNRPINARPWLYRIARNRCLNHLRRPVPEGRDSMDVLPSENGVSVAERVEKRAEFRALLHDVQGLPETQRSALLLREIDALAYEEIAIAMDTTVPAVKSLLVRARISLADASAGRHLTCDEVHLELAEATEGLRKVTGPARAHMKDCERCRDYRTELRRNGKGLAALAPIGPLAALSHAIGSKLGIGGAKAGAGSGAGAGAGAGAGTGVGAGGTAIGGAGASAAAAGSGVGALGLAGGAGLGGAALGAKAAVVASMALLTAGAVEVHHIATTAPGGRPAALERPATAAIGNNHRREMHGTARAANPGLPAGQPPAKAETPTDDAPTPADPPPADPPAADAPPAPPADPPADAAVGDPAGGTDTGDTTNPGDSGGVISVPPPDDSGPPITDPPTDPPPVDPPSFDPAPDSDESGSYVPSGSDAGGR